MALSIIVIPKSATEAFSLSGLATSHEAEISALCDWHTWDLVDPPTDYHLVGCHWVFSIKYHPCSTIDRLKVCLVEQVYTNTWS